MEYDLIMLRGHVPETFVVQHSDLTDRQGGKAIWPDKMPELPEMSVRSVATLILKRGMGYAEAQRMKERCERAWGKYGYGLNYTRLP
jgi:hypothetical protein